MSKFTLLMFIAASALALAANASPGDKSKKYCSETHVGKSGRIKRIIGGIIADDKEFSHAVALSYEVKGNYKFLCAGSLISDKYVLTAATCINTKIPVSVRLGDLNLESDSDDANAVDVKIARVLKHPDYDGSKVQNDIGLIELESKIEFNDNIRPACLNTEKSSTDADSFIAIGWGQTEIGAVSPSLMKVTLNEIASAECIKTYKSRNITINGESQICTNSKTKDTCRGDSGGALQKLNPDFSSAYDIYGITSFGSRNCASGFPSVFTRVSYYIDWIESIVFASDAKKWKFLQINRIALKMMNICKQANEYNHKFTQYLKANCTNTLQVSLPSSSKRGMSKFTLLIFIAVSVLASTANASAGDKSKKYCSETHVGKSGRIKRIIGGTIAEDEEFSHAVALSYDVNGNKKFLCAGSLISDKYVLTAATCINTKIPVSVRLGDLNLESDSDDANAVDVKIARVLKHPDYDGSKVQNDIGLIELESKIEFNDNIRPACLNTEKSSTDADSFIAIGWGQTEIGAVSPSLMKVTLNEIASAECIKTYKYRNITINGESQICTNSKTKDTCRGDSGGALQKLNPDFSSAYDIYGITSFGSRNCASGFPSVFTRVSYYIDWIESIVFVN
ncbi:PREDICTED: uncharacterized protein LOC108563242 [Nicrophorus vespilloides]|uniref:Uncharacterized protein LOC108563242 n=1 Tax=Nicrophorus vespilloides TaxID=110193 RepID=A0ABM1MS00_NICVS|nr:PREDICTED: uncharacterized protein LOC108563242 [Nicrophorus vespilloides]